MVWFMSTLTQHPTPQCQNYLSNHHQTTFFANMYIQMSSSCRTFIDCSFVKIQGRSTLHFVNSSILASVNLVGGAWILFILFLFTCFLLGAVAVDSVEFLFKILPCCSCFRKQKQQMQCTVQSQWLSCLANAAYG